MDTCMKESAGFRQRCTFIEVDVSGATSMKTGAS